MTGVAGFLGSWIAERFRDRGGDVVGIDNLHGGRMANAPDGVLLAEIDGLDRERYLPLMRDTSSGCGNASMIRTATSPRS